MIKLIAAHLIGDFMLLSERLCNMEYDADYRKRLFALSIHSCIQAVLSYLLVADWSNFLIPVMIFISHFIIDFIKVVSGKKNLPTLVIDQIAHYGAILFVWWILFVKTEIILYSHIPLYIWLVATSYLAVVAPASIFIKSFIEFEGWMPNSTLSQGLPNAGKWIGYLERVLILTFIFTENVEGIGFLLAAKSVFRFGELSKAKDIKITEYVLIGTFLSFTIAILIGFIVQWIKQSVI